MYIFWIGFSSQENGQGSNANYLDIKPGSTLKSCNQIFEHFCTCIIVAFYIYILLLYYQFIVWVNISIYDWIWPWIINRYLSRYSTIVYFIYHHQRLVQIKLYVLSQINFISLFQSILSHFLTLHLFKFVTYIYLLGALPLFLRGLSTCTEEISSPTSSLLAYVQHVQTM